MQITVFGATGGIGRHLVDQLLDADHQVVGYARAPDKLQRRDPRLRVVVGELDDPAGITEAIRASDAVISALGPSLERGATGTPVTEGTRAIVAAMHDTGVRRYIGLATPSIPDPHDRPTLTARVLPLMAKAFPNALIELRWQYTSDAERALGAPGRRRRIRDRHPRVQPRLLGP